MPRANQPLRNPDFARNHATPDFMEWREGEKYPRRVLPAFRGPSAGGGVRRNDVALPTRSEARTFAQPLN